MNARTKSKKTKEAKEITQRFATLSLVQQTQTAGSGTKTALSAKPREMDLFGPQTQLSILLSQRELLRIEIEQGRKYQEQLKESLEIVDEQIGALRTPDAFESRRPEESLFALLRAAG
jgi:hypothetical protein